MNNEDIQRHVAGTYRSLRWGLVVIALALPLFLWLVGVLWYGVAWQNSLSAYYYAESAGSGLVKSWLTQVNVFPIKQLLFFLAELDPEAPMRTWFVGGLFVLGVFLYLYKGFSHVENWLLNAAGLLALGVALFPMGKDCALDKSSCSPGFLHGFCAYAAFGCLAAVAVFCSKQTLSLPGPHLTPEKINTYRLLYNGTAVAMVLFPVAAHVLTWITRQPTKVTFWMEALGLWSFSLYWAVKGRELEENRTVIRALRGAVQTSSEPVVEGVPSLGLKRLVAGPEPKENDV